MKSAAAILGKTAGATFSNELVHAVAKAKLTENVILSPISIKSCLALCYLGVEGEAAREFERGLQLNGTNKEATAAEYSKLFEKTKAVEDVSLKIANRLYIDKKYDISHRYNELAEKYFQTKAEEVNFADAVCTAELINKWVESKTENKIQNTVVPSSLDGSTAAILINAIYFKAKWYNNFDGFATEKKDFSLSKERSVKVDMMFQKDTFHYGELQDLDAKAVEMAYVNTDITMLVVLPNQVDGLKALEDKLRQVDISDVSKQLQSEKVRLSLPKFKIEFDISLQPVLEQLGIKTIFTQSADFSSLLGAKEPLSIAEVKHKAFIEVNEEGTEAAGATYAKAYLLSHVLNEVVYDFAADHPFFFVIKDNDHIYFAGHVAEL